jgi:hypothetical protein
VPTTLLFPSYVLSDNPTTVYIVNSFPVPRLLHECGVYLHSRTGRERIADCSEGTLSPVLYLPLRMNRLSVLAVYENSCGSGAVIQLLSVKGCLISSRISLLDLFKELSTYPRNPQL